MADAIDQIDSTIDVITPENIAFEYQLAGPFRRLPAFMIDLAIRSTLLILFQILMLTLASDTVSALPAILLLWFGLEWFYGGVLEAYWNGQTVGKRLMGIRVLQIDGQPINGMQAMLRNILRSMDMMPLFPLFIDEAAPGSTNLFIPTGVIGLCSAILTRRYQRLGDLACGTMVVVEERRRLAGTVKGLDKSVVALAEQLPANLIVTRKISNALAAYVERRKYLAVPRIKEIAKHLGRPLAAQLRLEVPGGNYDTLLCALYYRTFVRTGTQETLDKAVSGGVLKKEQASPLPTTVATTVTTAGPKEATQ